MTLKRVNKDGEEKTLPFNVLKDTMVLPKVEMEEAGVGDIVIISGLEEVTIGDTLCALDNTVKLKPILIEEPTLSIDFMVNSGPLPAEMAKTLI